MPAKIRTPEHPLTHWSRVQAAVLNRFNWPAKGKVNPKLVVRLASQVADLALAEYRDRLPKRRSP